jgi:hypothetical protein
MRIDFCRGVLKLGASLTAIIILTVPAIAQEPDVQAFEVVPPQHRGSLVQSLLEFVECEKTQKYARLYEMLDEEEASRTNKENYVAARVKAETKRGALRKFAPQLVMDLTLNDSAPVTYEVTGKAWVRVGSDIVEKRMSTTATLHGDIWKFSELSDSFLDVQKTRQLGDADFLILSLLAAVKSNHASQNSFQIDGWFEANVLIDL